MWTVAGALSSLDPGRRTNGRTRHQEPSTRNGPLHRTGKRSQTHSGLFDDDFPSGTVEATRGIWVTLAARVSCPPSSVPCMKSPVSGASASDGASSSAPATNGRAGCRPLSGHRRFRRRGRPPCISAASGARGTGDPVLGFPGGGTGGRFRRRGTRQSEESCVSADGQRTKGRTRHQE